MSLAASFQTLKGDRSAASSAAAARAQKDQRPAASGTTTMSASRSSTPAAADLKRKRPEENVTYSQPAATGLGQEMMTRVHYAVEYLKEKDRPIKFDDIFKYLSIPPDRKDEGRRLRSALMSHHKVEFDKGAGTFKFRPVHNVRSADELRAYLQRQTTAAGIKVPELKDGWPGAVDAIDLLEREGTLLVTRNKKDNAPKMIWPNDPSLGLSVTVDDDFQAYWHKIKVPDSTDLRKELEKAGLTPTSQVKEAPQVSAGGKKKKRINRKAGRSTNTHMSHILKEYPMKASK
ncbi:hypothetical protein MBLNU457_g0993t1 [Dothideomycetes sp. NU457]